MYYVYVLKSLINGTYYKGSTADLDKRLKYHNSGKSKYTKKYRPWEIHYYETFETKKEALKKELFFKTVSGYMWLKNRKII